MHQNYRKCFANLPPFTPHSRLSSSKRCLWDGMRTCDATVSKNFDMKTPLGPGPLQELCQRPQPFESIPQQAQAFKQCWNRPII